jgi:hypothetical protein
VLLQVETNVPQERIASIYALKIKAMLSSEPKVTSYKLAASQLIDIFAAMRTSNLHIMAYHLLTVNIFGVFLKWKLFLLSHEVFLWFKMLGLVR